MKGESKPISPSLRTGEGERTSYALICYGDRYFLILEGGELEGRFSWFYHLHRSLLEEDTPVLAVPLVEDWLRGQGITFRGFLNRKEGFLRRWVLKLVLAKARRIYRHLGTEAIAPDVLEGCPRLGRTVFLGLQPQEIPRLTAERRVRGIGRNWAEIGHD